MILAPIAVFAMRLITEKDDQSFRIIGVSLLLGVRQKHKNLLGWYALLLCYQQ
ncbi:hypothetical protein C1H71_20030 (plasmid) [Iodobacter fluviatilis]|uniref:Uncharacterized protein n=2 Tax=Iodobacter fluviatilis TaxID=537 RepID=A0A7G3GF86_9NEIS|nr:hypothetical protein C1H71_20030 [Iodobacter fluviatilis]